MIRNKGELLNHIHAASGLPDDRLEGTVTAVLHRLHQQLGAEADDLEAQLPVDIKPMFTGGSGVMHRIAESVKRPHRLRYDEFVDEVAHEGNVDRAKAEQVTLAVFHEIKDQVSAGESRHVTDALPDEIARVWAQA